MWQSSTSKILLESWANMSFLKELEELKVDRISGASDLARKAAEILVGFSKETKSPDNQRFLIELTKLGKSLIAAQPESVPIFNLVNSILLATEHVRESLALSDLRNFTYEKAQEFKSNSLKALDRIAIWGMPLIENNFKIMTISNSTAVYYILRKAKQGRTNFEVYVPESRPVFEGRLLAKKLADLGISVHLITDASMGHFIGRINLILVGADCISETTFTNKVGTWYLALLAKEFKIPFFVASERSKFISELVRKKGSFFGNPQEVWEGNSDKIEIENPYFEQIPLSYCKKFITNDGFFVPSQIPKTIRKSRVSQDLLA
ncbi:MAG: hypothetical protein RBG1_1C00001G1424 [candidate division Zixibacteria bacterium RBG-1]|nr:MAG: hypothetical protein RBG1_1C00001G1424 [candidate division Zixibacteria bacterium RBG-1]OGC84521.1 MAG: hypothetical protein A2V73_01690 [candidate division Zixibacteria bacterium RBG_19FT_COMBO_42_43]